MKGIVGATEEEALKELLDAFSSECSLDEIASAYYNAKGNVNIAGDILCARNDGRNLNARADTIEKSVDLNTRSVELLSRWESENESTASPNTGVIKSKKCSVSMGSVSGVIGKGYVQPRPSRMDSLETSKPVKIDAKEFPVSAIWPEEDPSNMTTRNGTTNANLEGFLLEMLGDGFQLEKSVIQEVIGCCGFDVTKCMDKLLDLSASTLEKSDDVIGTSVEKIIGKHPDDQVLLIQDKPQAKGFAESKGATYTRRNTNRSAKRYKDKVALEKEVLETLFAVPERSEEAPKRTNGVRVVRRSRVFGEVVTGPLKDTDICLTTKVVELLKVPKDVEDGHDDNENSYDSLRQAVKEYWVTMKEYYKAAVEAYADGDKARAAKLAELGHFFNKKAREADDRSSDKMLETRDEEILSLDLRTFEPKEALRLLRVHLTNFSGIPPFKNIRIIVGTLEEDTKKGARRRLLKKQLEKDAIEWKEEEDGRIISFRIDTINPKLLSFTKN